MIDGYKVVEYLKKNEPETFEILKKIEVKFINNDYTQKTIRIVNSPIITLNNSFLDFRIFPYCLICSASFFISDSISLIPKAVNFCSLKSRI